MNGPRGERVQCHTKWLWLSVGPCFESKSISFFLSTIPADFAPAECGRSKHPWTTSRTKRSRLSRCLGLLWPAGSQGDGVFCLGRRECTRDTRTSVAASESLDQSSPICALWKIDSCDKMSARGRKEEKKNLSSFTQPILSPPPRLLQDNNRSVIGRQQQRNMRPRNPSQTCHHRGEIFFVLCPSAHWWNVILFGAPLPAGSSPSSTRESCELSAVKKLGIFSFSYFLSRSKRKRL